MKVTTKNKKKPNSAINAKENITYRYDDITVMRLFGTDRFIIQDRDFLKDGVPFFHLESGKVVFIHEFSSIEEIKSELIIG